MRTLYILPRWQFFIYFGKDNFFGLITFSLPPILIVYCFLDKQCKDLKFNQKGQIFVLKILLKIGKILNLTFTASCLAIDKEAT